eukprot:gene26420-35069_t
MVGSSLLLDPVIFLLCDPTVATMFVYKDPSNALDLLIDKPLGDNIGRSSPEKRDNKKKPIKHTIILSSRDVIVPVERVGGFEVLVFGGGTHGEAV